MFTYLCISEGDIAYGWKTESDSSWQNEDESWDLFPEGLAFSTKAYEFALGCAGDCLLSFYSSMAQNLMFWCVGCWGMTYPVAGSNTAVNSDVATSALLSARLVTKLHRLCLLMSNYIDSNYCYYHCYPNLDKAQYKWQLAYPVRSSWPTTCFPTGLIPFTWEYVKKYPGKEDWVYVLWRHTKCCLL